MNDYPQLTFIGAGNMAGAIIGGLVRTGYPADRISASAPDQSHLDSLSADYGIQTTTDNHQAAASADVLILAVKPQIMGAVCQDLAPVLADRMPLVITIAAGIELATLSDWLAKPLPMVRCMPNTPAMVLRGATGLYANDLVDAEQRSLAEKIFSAIGIVEWVSTEDQIHAITAISGSGPAYFFLMIEALEDAARKIGIDEESARRLATQTILGAAEMASQQAIAPAQLRHNVTSPGGTTERAIQTFEDGGLRELFDAAVQSAFARSRELAKNN